MLVRSLRVVVALSVCLPAIVYAQQPRTLTTEDYAHAERWMAYNVAGLVQHTVSGVQFLPRGMAEFYRDPGPDGTVYMIADPAKGTTAPAFDNAKMETALRAATKRAFEAKRLGRRNAVHTGCRWVLRRDGRWKISLRCGRRALRAGARTGCACPSGREAHRVCLRSAAMRRQTRRRRPRHGLTQGGRGRSSDTSPDKKYAAFIRDNNLWVRVNAAGEEKQLTTDGVKDYGYATNNAGWTHSDGPIVLWSPDSTRIATFQQDQRKTGSMYLVPVTNRHPVLEEWKYPLVGDKDVTTIERVVIDVDTAKMTRLKMPPDQHRSTECDDIWAAAAGRAGAMWSSRPMAAHLAFVSTSRDHKDEWLHVADPATGEVRDVFHEHADTYYGWQSKVNWKYLPQVRTSLSGARSAATMRRVLSLRPDYR